MRSGAGGGSFTWVMIPRRLVLLSSERAYVESVIALRMMSRTAVVAGVHNKHMGIGERERGGEKARRDCGTKPATSID